MARKLKRWVRGLRDTQTRLLDSSAGGALRNSVVTPKEGAARLLQGLRRGGPQRLTSGGDPDCGLRFDQAAARDLTGGRGILRAYEPVVGRGRRLGQDHRRT